jgi:predicted component of type VI protein secretion system
MRSFAKYILPILLAVALLAGCGSSSDSGSVGGDDVAVVGNTHITKTEYDQLIAQAKQSLGKTFPKQGTAEYQALKSKASAPKAPPPTASRSATSSSRRG